MITAKKKIIDTTSSIDALESIGADFEVAPINLMTTNGIDVPNHNAIVRIDNNKILSVMNKTYQPIQNTDAFAFFDAVVEKYNAKYENAYLCNEGQKVILQASINEFDVRNNDTVKNYITLVNGHDGKTAFKCFFTPIRLLCDNQLHAAMKDSTNSITIKHTIKAESRIETALRILGAGMDYFEKFQHKAKILANKVSDKYVVNKFLNDFYGDQEKGQISKKKTKVEELIYTGKGNNGSSLWDVYNGITEYIDHYKYEDKEKALGSAVLSGNSEKSLAFNSLMECV